MHLSDTALSFLSTLYVIGGIVIAILLTLVLAWVAEEREIGRDIDDERGGDAS